MKPRKASISSTQRGRKNVRTADDSSAGDIPSRTDAKMSRAHCTGTPGSISSIPTIQLPSPGTPQPCGGVSFSIRFIHVVAMSGGRPSAKRSSAPRAAATCPGLQSFGGSCSSRRHSAKQGPALDAGLAVYRYRISRLRARFYSNQDWGMLTRPHSGEYCIALGNSYFLDYHLIANPGSPREAVGIMLGRIATSKSAGSQCFAPFHRRF